MTKASFKLILAALAAASALSACTKEITPPNFENDKVNPAAEGTRVIAVSFGNATKTDFTTTKDGISPFFEIGDKIVLCSDIQNPTDDNTQTSTVFFDEKTKALSITTTLSGTLKAYYPASLVTQSSKHGLFIYVPSAQDGTFAKANICSATITENAASATFDNDYALFAITPPAGTKKLTIKSLLSIGDDGQRSGEKRVICATGEDYYKITVGDGTKAIPSPCYVAMIANVNLSDLSFEATSDAEGTTGFIKGIPTSAIAAQAGTGVTVGSEAYNTCNTVAEGAAYTIDDSNWHEYVTVGDYKWATMNIGATSPTDAGEYFMWSEVKGHKFESNVWTNFPETNPDESRYNSDLWDSSKCFSGENIPYVTAAEWKEEYEGFGYWEYTCSKYNDDSMGLLLSLSDDAANVNWGGAWRIPKVNEYESLITKYNWTDKGGIYGMEYGTSPNTVFFPALGIGQGKDLRSSSLPIIWARYWTSESTGTRGGERNLVLGIDSEAVGAIPETALDYGVPRCQGCNVRAIVDEPAEEDGEKE